MAKNLNLEEDDNTVHEGNDVRRWHQAAVRECPLFRRFSGLSGHPRRSPIGRDFMSTRPKQKKVLGAAFDLSSRREDEGARGFDDRPSGEPGRLVISPLDRETPMRENARYIGTSRALVDFVNLSAVARHPRRSRTSNQRRGWR
jgi:hypothetical protein